MKEQKKHPDDKSTSEESTPRPDLSQDENKSVLAEKSGDSNVTENQNAFAKSRSPKPAVTIPNQLREIRIENMMSKAELARKAGLSVLTVSRIEKGYGCRMDTKRKLLKALDLKLADRRKVFEDE